LVFLNDGSGTRLKGNGETSKIDLTITSNNLAAKCNWFVNNDTFGSDHFLIETHINVEPIEEEIITKKWSFKKADWNMFNQECKDKLNDSLQSEDPEVYNNKTTEVLINIANDTIPKTKGKLKNRNPVPFWTEECDKAVKGRENAKRKVMKSRNSTDYINYKQKKAMAQKVTRTAKKTWWHDYCTKLNRQSNLSKVWKIVKRMSNNFIGSAIPTLKKDNISYITNKDKANIFGKHFAQVSSDKNYSKDFLKHKNKFEKDNKDKIKYKNNSESAFNEDFSLPELRQALKKCKNTSPGQDDVTYDTCLRSVYMLYLDYLILYGKLVQFQKTGNTLL
jgi:hypothetical protein